MYSREDRNFSTVSRKLLVIGRLRCPFFSLGEEKAVHVLVEIVARWAMKWVCIYILSRPVDLACLCSFFNSSFFTLLLWYSCYSSSSSAIYYSFPPIQPSTSLTSQPLKPRIVNPFHSKTCLSTQLRIFTLTHVFINTGE